MTSRSSNQRPPKRKADLSGHPRISIAVAGARLPPFFVPVVLLQRLLICIRVGAQKNADRQSPIEIKLRRRTEGE